jgi:hypothetical protein
MLSVLLPLDMMVSAGLQYYVNIGVNIGELALFL